LSLRGSRNAALKKALELYWTDYLAYCRRKGEPVDGQKLPLALLRLIVSPSLRALLLIRIANGSPRPTWWIWRNLFVHLYAMDWSGPLEIGPGLELPHPLGTCLVDGAKIGSRVGIGHCVTLAGGYDDRRPIIGDDVVLYPGVVIVGGVEIGAGSIISANCVVQRDVPPGKILTARGLIPVAARATATQ
jgi:serine acetyltransferase